MNFSKYFYKTELVEGKGRPINLPRRPLLRLIVRTWLRYDPDRQPIPTFTMLILSLLALALTVLLLVGVTLLLRFSHIHRVQDELQTAGQLESARVISLLESDLLALQGVGECIASGEDPQSALDRYRRSYSDVRAVVLVDQDGTVLTRSPELASTDILAAAGADALPVDLVVGTEEAAGQRSVLIVIPVAAPSGSAELDGVLVAGIDSEHYAAITNPESTIGIMLFSELDPVYLNAASELNVLPFSIRAASQAENSGSRSYRVKAALRRLYGFQSLSALVEEGSPLSTLDWVVYTSMEGGEVFRQFRRSALATQVAIGLAGLAITVLSVVVPLAVSWPLRELAQISEEVLHDRLDVEIRGYDRYDAGVIAGALERVTSRLQLRGEQLDLATDLLGGGLADDLEVMLDQATNALFTRLRLRSVRLYLTRPNYRDEAVIRALHGQWTGAPKVGDRVLLSE
nr:cache domain-containing protein [Anaerolineae bacterium]